jgi:hypothetical protein
MLLSKVIDGIEYAGGTELNRLTIDADFRGNVNIDPQQLPKLAEYWELKLKQ